MQPRRRFIQLGAASATVVASSSSALAKKSPNNRLRVGVMGMSRGLAHVRGFLKVPNVEIAYVCDVDSRRREGAAQEVAKNGQKTPVKQVSDFRRILEDEEVDVLSIATPNFWHTPATILGCQAGKHVYVEKPGSHTAKESQLIVEATRKYERKVQMGNQRRSVPGIIEGIERVKNGEIGTLRYARCWYDNTRGSIGKGKQLDVPSWLNYDLWQGPSVRRPYKSNLVHYHWHWQWHWGNGELGNNGVHFLDVARWGLGVTLPHRTTCNGGRYHHDDDQDSPDSSYAVYDFGNVGASFDSSSCLPRKHENHPFVSFYGDKGVLSIENGGYTIHDPAGKVIANRKAGISDVPHFTNFANAIREGEALNAEIEDAQRAALMCHLGNIAYRTGTVVDYDEKKGTILTNPEARKLWSKEYDEAWEPKV